MKGRGKFDRDPTIADSKSYAALADEYYDSAAHPTCYNLNRLSRLYLESRFPEPWVARTTVEVGAGDSCVAAILHARGYRLDNLLITDSSESMLQHSTRWSNLGARLQVCDATKISSCAHSVDLLVASLGDPYNVPAFWEEADRVLAPQGRLLFTMPSYEWSSRFRGSDDSKSRFAEFVLRDGSRLAVPSFVHSLSQQITLMENAGFVVVAFASFGDERLDPREPRSPKIDVFAGGRSSVVWGFDLARRAPC